MVGVDVVGVALVFRLQIAAEVGGLDPVRQLGADVSFTVHSR